VIVLEKIDSEKTMTVSARGGQHAPVVSCKLIAQIDFKPVE
jgi:hypothetical protein